MCLTIRDNVRSDGKRGGEGRLGTPHLRVISLALSVLLVLATAFAVSHSLHRLLHDDGNVGHSFCLLCSFAKGQVTGTDPGLISIVAVLSLLGPVASAPDGFFQGYDCLLSPSRGPPGRQ
jgi:hypothetical protein